LTGDLSKIVGQVAKILNLPVGGLLGAIENLIKSLGPLLVQLLEVVKKLVQELLKDLTNVTDDLLNQLVKSGGLFSALLKLVSQLQTILNSLTSTGVGL
jgi:phage-related protein